MTDAYNFFKYFFKTISPSHSNRLKLMSSLDSFNQNILGPTQKRDFLGVKSRKFNSKLPKFDSFWKTLDGRSSQRDFVEESISFKKFELLVSASIGQNRKEDGNFFRRNPTAGGLVAMQYYFISYRIDGLDEGIYYINEEFEELYLIGSAPTHVVLEKMLQFEDIKNIAGVVIICSDFTLLLQKYAEQSLKLALLDAGHAMQNFYLSAQKLGLKFVSLGGIDEQELSKLLEIKNEYEKPIYAGVIGA